MASKSFWLKYSLKCIAIVILFSCAFTWFKSNYRIGLDFQDVKCLPGYTVFLVDIKDKDLKKGTVYAFTAVGLDPFFKDGTLMAKRFMAGHGDRIKIEVETERLADITINKYPKIIINNEVVREGLPLAIELGKSEKDFAGSKTLTKDELWMLGDSPMSFDSRYWGTVNKTQVVGRAYPLF